MPNLWRHLLADPFDPKPSPRSKKRCSKIPPKQKREARKEAAQQAQRAVLPTWWDHLDHDPWS